MPSWVSRLVRTCNSNITKRLILIIMQWKLRHFGTDCHYMWHIPDCTAYKPVKELKGIRQMFGLNHWHYSWPNIQWNQHLIVYDFEVLYRIGYRICTVPWILAILTLIGMYLPEIPPLNVGTYIWSLFWCLHVDFNAPVRHRSKCGTHTEHNFKIQTN